MTESRVARKKLDPRSDETRTKLILATIDQVAEQGWSSCSVRTIANRAGVTFGLVNYHFGSKADLMVAAVDHAISQLVPADAEGTRTHNLRDYLKQTIDAIRTNLGNPSVKVFLEASLQAQQEPLLRQRVTVVLGSFRDEIEACLVPLVGSDQAKGHALALAALLDGLLLHSVVDPEGLDLDAVQASLLQWVIRRS